MQTTGAITDNVEGKPSQQKELDGIKNAAIVQIVSGLTCIGLQVSYAECSTPAASTLPLLP